jgi:hypothetical protein
MTICVCTSLSDGRQLRCGANRKYISLNEPKTGMTTAGYAVELPRAKCSGVLVDKNDEIRRPQVPAGCCTVRNGKEYAGRRAVKKMGQHSLKWSPQVQYALRTLPWQMSRPGTGFSCSPVNPHMWPSAPRGCSTEAAFYGVQ